MPYYYRITCRCGHEASASLSKWLHRDEVLRRARCTACGRRAAIGLVTENVGEGGGAGWEERRERLRALPVINV